MSSGPLHYGCSLAWRLRRREFRRRIRGSFEMRGHIRASFLFARTRNARTQRCSVESDNKPAIRKGIPGMTGNSIPMKPMPRHVHPISFRQNPPLCLCRISVVLTRVFLSANECLGSDSAKIRHYFRLIHPDHVPAAEPGGVPSTAEQSRWRACHAPPSRYVKMASGVPAV